MLNPLACKRWLEANKRNTNMSEYTQSPEEVCAIAIWRAQHDKQPETVTFELLKKYGDERVMDQSELLANMLMTKASSPTFRYVLLFAARMEAKLAKNRHKGDRNGWINCNPDELAFRIENELAELEEALRRVRHKENIVVSEREAIANEAADVANFAMMIADIYTGKPEASNAEASEPEL